MYIYTLGVQRPLNKWPFRKDHYFSRDLQSTIPGDYYFNGLWLPGYIYIYMPTFSTLFQMWAVSFRGYCGMITCVIQWCHCYWERGLLQCAHESIYKFSLFRSQGRLLSRWTSSFTAGIYQNHLRSLADLLAKQVQKTKIFGESSFFGGTGSAENLHV